MKRLLGLENELYYVNEGTVNKYAMGFVIPVPTRYDSMKGGCRIIKPVCAN